MKRSPHHTALLSLAISVTILVAALFAYMYYQVNSSLERAVQAGNIAEVHRTHKDREKDLRALFEETAAERSRLIGFFVPSDSTVQFIEAIESLGPVAGSVVTLSSIDQSLPEGSPPGTRGIVSAHIDVRGPWAAVMKTLMLAENLPYHISINQVRLDSSLPTEGRAVAREWRLSFDLKASTIVPPSLSGESTQ
jgi:hypothetical protein